MSDAAFAEAHGMGAHAWPMPPSTEPYRISVRYEIPPDCTFRAVVTGAADLVSISNIAAQTDGDETIFPLPSGSGSFEIEIMSNGTDTNGLIQLVMGVGGDVEYCFDSQAFETISSILEKKERFTMNGDEERTAFRLHPALNGFTAEWNVCCEDLGTPRLFTAETGGTAAKTIADAFNVWASSGRADDNFDIEATLAGNYATETATLKVFSMIFEPITSEINTLGKTVNPSCVVVGRSGYFRTTVYGSISNSDIKWSASSETAGLQTQSGPMAEVIPTACGMNTLIIQVGDYERAKGMIEFLSVEETTTEIRAFILGTTDGFPRTAAEVTNYIAEVNRIYGQTGMKFVLSSVTNITLTEDQLKINRSGGLTDADICNIATNTGGLELYFVPETGRKGIPAYSYGAEGRDLGIIIGTNAAAVTVAHEIGHACGLSDIYDSIPNVTNLEGCAFTWQNLPYDWGSTSEEITFYSRKSLPSVIRNLLMNGYEHRVGTDIPLGPVFGIWYDQGNGDSEYLTNLWPVGVIPDSYFNRHPRHE